MLGVAGQVRRTVGALVGVAHGRVSLQDIQHMLDEPSHKNWVCRAQVAYPDGLYLLEVEYPPHAFKEREGEVESDIGRKEVVCESKGEVVEGKGEVEVNSKGEVEFEDKEEVKGESKGEESGSEREGGGEVEVRKASGEDCER